MPTKTATKAKTKPNAAAKAPVATVAPAAAKPAARRGRKPKAETAPQRQQPDVVQPGRFYHYQDNGAHVVGELAKVNEDGTHAVKVWSMGSASGEVRSMDPAGNDVREISRSEAHDISKVH